jgi:uncharacterized protein YacL
MKSAVVVGLSWSLFVGASATLFLVDDPHAHLTWQESLRSRWPWVVSSAVLTALVVATLTHRWLRPAHSAWKWIGAWLSIGIAAAGAAALGIVLGVSLTVMQTSDLGDLAASAARWSVALFAFITFPLMVAAAVVTVPLGTRPER